MSLGNIPTCDTYRNGNDWSKMIVFDNEKEAIETKKLLQDHIYPYTTE